MLADTLWRGPRPPLHVLDVAAWETMQSLAAAGLITLHARVTRPLLDPGDKAELPALTPEQQARCEALRALAQRKARAARALFAADLFDEGRTALRDAALAHAQAAAIARRRPEPAALAEILHPAFALVWPDDFRPAIMALIEGTIPVPAASLLVEQLLLRQPS